MTALLVAIPFDESLLSHVQGFSCGEEGYERELADWIRLESIPAIRRGGKVWLYATEAREVVGFSSLAITRWRYPSPSDKRVSLAIIPAVAIQKSFWGKPAGPPEGRYSSQILDHLLDEAGRLPLDQPSIGLFVHPDNGRAIRAYERAGFQRFSHTYADPATGVVYSSMVRRLYRA